MENDSSSGCDFSFFASEEALVELDQRDAVEVCHREKHYSLLLQHWVLEDDG